MNRIVAALLIWIVFAGGPLLYVKQRKSPQAVQASMQKPAAGVLSMSLTPSFELVPDPFAIDADQSYSARVLLNGQEVWRETHSISAGTEMHIENASGLVEGMNEFFVEGFPFLEDSNRSHALRLRILRDGTPIADHTFWSEPGAPVVEGFQIEVQPFHEDKNSDHDH